MSGTTEVGEALCADGAITVPEAVRLSGLSRTAIYALMSRGELPYIHITHRRLIPRRAIVSLLARGLEGSHVGRC